MRNTCEKIVLRKYLTFLWILPVFKSHLTPLSKKTRMFCWNCFSHWVICLEIPLKLSNPAAIPYKRYKMVIALKDLGSLGLQDGGTWGLGRWSWGSAHCSDWRKPPQAIHPEVPVSHAAVINIASPAIMVNIKRLGESQQRLDHSFLISTEMNSVLADQAVCFL